ncbi:MAG: hypothetical protein Q7R30_09415 [Acidobacteriota bacterium]|nr:hypothetical protein [Acidobacteriota bacterium]
MPHGREIFFVVGQRLWAVPVRTNPRFEVGEPTPLFELPSQVDIFSSNVYPYNASPDGQRFVVLRERAAANSSAVTVVVNWMAALNLKPNR